MTISSLSSENLLITQKLLQDVSDNKKLNLSAEQKIAFKEVLTEALLGNGINTISDIQKQSIINELKNQMVSIIIFMALILQHWMAAMYRQFNNKFLTV